MWLHYNVAKYWIFLANIYEFKTRVKSFKIIYIYISRLFSINSILHFRAFIISFPVCNAKSSCGAVNNDKKFPPAHTISHILKNEKNLRLDVKLHLREIYEYPLLLFRDMRGALLRGYIYIHNIPFLLLILTLVDTPLKEYKRQKKGSVKKHSTTHSFLFVARKTRLIKSANKYINYLILHIFISVPLKC